MYENKYAQLYEELVQELYSCVKTRPIDSPNYKRQSDLMQRARQAAGEIEARGQMTVEEVEALICLSNSPSVAARQIVARFGGGEGEA